MTKDQIQQEEERLKAASVAYYNGEPTMSDSEYDAAFQAHMRTLAQHPDFESEIKQQVGAAPDPNSGFEKMAHAEPMLSLDNVFEDEADGCEELNAWLEGVEKVCGSEAALLVEPKMDGLSLELVYQNGEIVAAITRGDGNVGDNVIANVKAGRMAPTTIPLKGVISVRGEVIMDFPTFNALNEQLAAAGEKAYANPRNAAAGALRLRDPEECAKRGLRFIAYGAIGGAFSSQNEAMTALASYGFSTPWEHGIMATDRIPSVKALRELVASGLTYPIDGLVFKLDEYHHRDMLGAHSRAPKWAVALKFQQEKVTTIVRSITVQVGRSGVLTPVAELVPVWVDGSTVSRATLHNEDQVRRLGLTIGDTVEVRKAAAIIPEVVKSRTAEYREQELTRYFRQVKNVSEDELKVIVNESMTAERPPFDLIKHLGGKCPSCGSNDLEKQQVAGEDGAKWCCTNDRCPAQLSARIEHFCSRKCLNIEGIGAEASGALAKWLVDFVGEMPLSMVGLLQIDEEELAALSWETTSGGTMTFGASRAKKAFDALQRAKNLPLHRWLFALGIPSIGENTSKEVSRLFRTPSELAGQCLPDSNTARILDLIAADKKDAPELKSFAISSDLGPASAAALLKYMFSPVGCIELTTLTLFGVVSDNYDPTPTASDDKPLFGKTFAITGTLSVGREEMKALIESKGGKVSGSVSKKTNFLVAGEGGGQKADKAREAGVTILDEAALRAML